MATEYQGIGSGILHVLKFKALPSSNEDGEMVCGGDQKYKVTPQTIRHLQSIFQKDMVVVLGGDGEITVELDSGAGSSATPRRRRRGA